MKIIIPTAPNGKKRHLKVYTRMWPKGNGFQPLPEIRLMGKWLEKNGFKCGQHIQVIDGQNRLIIINGEPRKLIL